MSTFYTRKCDIMHKSNCIKKSKSERTKRGGKEGKNYDDLDMQILNIEILCLIPDLAESCTVYTHVFTYLACIGIFNWFLLNMCVRKFHVLFLFDCGSFC